MQRSLKIALIAAAFALIAATPDSYGQRKRGGRRGAGGGRRAGAGLFNARKKKAPNASPSLSLVRPGSPTPAAPAKGAAPKPASPLAAEERRFRQLIDEIDAAIESAENQRAEAQTSGETIGFRLPDDVTPGSSEWRQLQRPIFETCDYDASGWLSFRETRAALDFDATEFARYDRDRDGRVGPREFMARYDEVVAQTGAFRVPKPADGGPKAEPRSSDQLRTAFDRDGDGALDESEVANVLAEYGRKGSESSVFMSSVDGDGNGRVEGSELHQLSRTVSYAFLAPVDADGRKGKPATLASLFGKVEERAGHVAVASEPPWLPGPVSHFRRLDLNADGLVALEELVRLQGSFGSNARLGAVLAALDLDEDGRISEREFSAALSTARK